ncbi:MAG TPA: hypothetical protein VFT29_19015 [Gemmatimonadaceae bacterium]|nr:hypothetical protein [Gemmatimonadaceae bacterium]
MRVRMTRQALRWWRGASSEGAIGSGIEITDRDERADSIRLRAVLQDQVQPTDVESRGTPTYDRRSAERGAAHDAAIRRSTDVAHRPVPTTAMRERVAAAVAETLDLERRLPAPLKHRAAVVIRPKPIPRSRTIWLNGLTMLAAGGMIVSDIRGLFSVALTLPEQTTMWVLLGVAVVNILLRFETCYPIGSPIVYRSPAPPRAPASSAARPSSGVVRDTR